MKRGAWLAVVSALAVALTAGGFVAGRFIRSPAEVAADAEPPAASLITAEVVRQRIEKTVIARGDLVPSEQVNVAAAGGWSSGESAPNPGFEVIMPGGGQVDDGGGSDGVLTDTFVAVGDAVDEGEVPIEVSERPLIVLRGPVPLTRDLRPGMTGGDVTQLQDALGRLGLYSGAGDGVFDQATSTAVTRLYAKAGYPAPATDEGVGTDDDTLIAADQAIDTARDGVTTARQGVTGARDAVASARSGLAAAKRALEDLRTERTEATAAREKARAKAVDEWTKAQAAAAHAAAQAAAAAAAAGGSTPDTGATGGNATGGASGSGGAGAGTTSSTSLADAIDEALASAPPLPTSSQFAAAKEAIEAAERALTMAKTEVKRAEDQVDEAKATVTDAQRAKERAAARIGSVAPRAEIAFAPQLPATVTGVASSVGFTVPAVLVTLTPSDLVVKVSGLAGVGTGVVAEGSVVELSMPDGALQAGAVVSVVPASDGTSAVDVVIAPDDVVDVGLAGVNIKVTFVEAATAGEVLGVPQGAISSDSAGELSVIVVDGPGATQDSTDDAGQSGQPELRRVPVTSGVAGTDLVEVTPTQPGTLDAGMLVVIGG
ncbi:MAG: peptidoglycan-binding protein [Bifidobacteriaceae bacterium]|jgi:peptidoglycan hydrolase CwlO-like protein|nr:peptidoglycan-binding protein [Bifidobacteriaceae bacterium]